MLDITAKKVSNQFVEVKIETIDNIQSLGLLDKDELYILCKTLNYQLKDLIDIQKTIRKND